MATKYIRTKWNEIIIFSNHQSHSDFKDFDPKSAGFISFGFDPIAEEIRCTCYGESDTLRLSTLPDDALLAEIQIING